MKAKTWFITGASQAIGFALMEQILKSGDNVVTTTCNAENLKNALSTDEEQLFIRLLPGSDAVEYATYKLQLMTEGIAATRELSISTDFIS